MFKLNPDVNISERFAEISNDHEKIADFIETLNDSELTPQQITQLVEVINSTPLTPINDDKIRARLYKAEEKALEQHIPTTVVALSLIGWKKELPPDLTMMEKKVGMLRSLLSIGQKEVAYELIRQNLLKKEELLEAIRLLDGGINEVLNSSFKEEQDEYYVVIDILEHHSWNNEDVDFILKNSKSLVLLLLNNSTLREALTDEFFKQVTNLLVSAIRKNPQPFLRILTQNPPPHIKQLLIKSLIDTSKFPLLKMVIQQGDSLDVYLKQLLNDKSSRRDLEGREDFLHFLVESGACEEERGTILKTIIVQAIGKEEFALAMTMLENLGPIDDVIEDIVKKMGELYADNFLFGLPKQNENLDLFLAFLIKKGISLDTKIGTQSLIDFIVSNQCSQAASLVAERDKGRIEMITIDSSTVLSISFHQTLAHLGATIVPKGPIHAMPFYSILQCSFDTQKKYLEDTKVSSDQKWKLLEAALRDGKDEKLILACINYHLEYNRKKLSQANQADKLLIGLRPSLRKLLLPRLKDFLKEKYHFYVLDLPELESLLKEGADEFVLYSTEYIEDKLKNNALDILNSIYERNPTRFHAAISSCNSDTIDYLDKETIEFLIDKNVFLKEEATQMKFFQAIISHQLTERFRQSKKDPSYQKMLDEKLKGELTLAVSQGKLFDQFFHLASLGANFSLADQKAVQIVLNRFFEPPSNRASMLAFVELLEKRHPGDPYAACMRYCLNTYILNKYFIQMSFEKNEPAWSKQANSLRQLFTEAGAKEHQVVVCAFLTKGGLYDQLREEAKKNILLFLKDRGLRSEPDQQKLYAFFESIDAQTDPQEKIRLLNLAFSGKTFSEVMEISQSLRILSSAKIQIPASIDATQLPKLVREKAYKALNFPNNTPTYEQYLSATSQWNDPIALSALALTYSRLPIGNMRDNALNSLRGFITDLSTGSYIENRYQIENNLHLSLLETFNPGIVNKWKQSSKQDLLAVLKAQKADADHQAQQSTAQWVKQHHPQINALDAQLGMPAIMQFLRNGATDAELSAAIKSLQEKMRAAGNEIKELRSIPKTKEVLENIKNLQQQQKAAQLERRLLMMLADSKPISKETLSGFYDLQRSIEALAPQSEFNDDVKQLLSVFTATAQEEENYSGWKLVNTDDPELMLMAGEYVLSCQRIYGGNPLYNRGLMGYVRNGETRMIAIVDERNKIKARVIVRLGMGMHGKATLLKEYPYPVANLSAKFKKALDQQIQALEKELSIKPAMPESLAEDVKAQLNIAGAQAGVTRAVAEKVSVIFAAGGPSPTTYFDTGEGVTDGMTTIEAFTFW